MKGAHRAAILAGWTALVAAVLAALPLAFWHRLPDPMAVHWSGTSPDSAMSRTAGLITLLLLWAALAAVVVAVDVYGNRPDTVLRAGERGAGSGGGSRARALGVAFPVLGGVGVLFAGLEAWTVWANLDRTDWRDAAHVGWPFVFLFVAGLAAGYAGWLVERAIAPPEPATRPADRPRLDLRPGERVAWTGEVANRPILWAGAALGVLFAVGMVGTVVGPWGPPLPVTLGALLLSGVLLVFGRVRVTADARGLRVVFGPLGWPVQRVALARITDVTVEDLRPMQVGGWGYRGLPGSAAVMLRGGPCLVVRYDEGRNRLIVSVDGAEEAAAVLNALRPVPAAS